jgi:glutathione S-transferase
LFIGQKNYSTCSLRAWIMLYKLAMQKGFTFTTENVELTGTGGFGVEAHMAYSRSGLVPCLHDSTFVDPATHVRPSQVWDSLAIMEHLHEAFPTAGVWPSDPIARSRARCFASEVHSGFGDLQEYFTCNIRLRIRVTEPIPPRVQVTAATCLPVCLPAWLQCDHQCL